MIRPHDSGLVLAVRPTARGFGWVLFEGPLAPADWGLVSARGDTSARAMRRFERLLNQYQPATVVLEKPSDERKGVSNRVRILAETMCGFAENRDIDVPIYTRPEVSMVVTGDEESTRHAVAQAVATRLPILRHRMPPKRKPWLPEDDRQSLYDAAALGITHYTLTHRAF